MNTEDSLTPSIDVQESTEGLEASTSTNDQSLSVLSDLRTQVNNLAEKIDVLCGLTSADEFKLVSKSTRNNLLYGMIDDMRSSEELVKIAFRSLKRVKRIRVNEQCIDELLGVPVHIITQKRGEEQDDENS